MALTVRYASVRLDLMLDTVLLQRLLARIDHIVGKHWIILHKSERDRNLD